MSAINNYNEMIGTLDAKGHRFAIVCARFNDLFVRQLLDGAMDTFIRHGGEAQSVDVVRVPGCYEIPMIVKKLALTGRYDAVIALGAVIQGATPHASLINAEVSKALCQIALETQIPVSYGIINADSLEQAIERAGTKAGNKGADAALAAIEMTNLMRGLSPNTRSKK